MDTGIFALVAVVMSWATLGIAAEHGHVEFSHGAGVGSVHFAPHGPPVHAGPVVRHVESEVAHAVYRNPYRDDYFRRFPPGYHPFMLNGAQYYGYYSLPAACQQVLLNGIAYFLCGGVYYSPYIYGGQTIYLVVPAPM